MFLPVSLPSFWAEPFFDRRHWEAVTLNNDAAQLLTAFEAENLPRRTDPVTTIMKASLERLSRLIKVCGFLMQTKVYLFWQKL
jgi:hypothetical protein